jgi:hypothetical protein
VSPKAFIFRAGEEFREELKGKSEFDNFATILELLHQENFDELKPEEVGALTIAPIIGQDVERNEGGDELLGVGDVWWYPRYETTDPWQELAEKGTVTFIGAPKNK